MIFVNYYWVVFLIVVVLNVGVLALISYRLKRQNSNELNNSVTEAVSHYFALQSQE